VSKLYSSSSDLSCWRDRERNPVGLARHPGHAAIVDVPNIVGVNNGVPLAVQLVGGSGPLCRSRTLAGGFGTLPGSHINALRHTRWPARARPELATRAPTTGPQRDRRQRRKCARLLWSGLMAPPAIHQLLESIFFRKAFLPVSRDRKHLYFTYP